MLIEDLDFVNYIIERSEKLNLSSTVPLSYNVENLSGNMNRVRRVAISFHNGSQSSFVVKHLPAGGKLEKYPSVAFPESRLHFEALFNRLCGEKLTSPYEPIRLPKLLDHDQDFRTLVFEDLSPSQSLTKAPLNLEELNQVIQTVATFLARLHSTTAALTPFENPAAQLNRPFVLTVALEKPQLVRELWENNNATKESSINDLSQLQDWFLKAFSSGLLPALRHLETSFKSGHLQVLTHGDLHGDSLLVLANGQLAIIDGELCDYGTPAFDNGIFLAHIIALSRKLSDNQQHTSLQQIALFWQTYKTQLKHSKILDQALLDSASSSQLYHESLQYLGAEIIRRILGPARYPFLHTIPDLRSFLTFAAKLISQPETFPLPITE